MKSYRIFLNVQNIHIRNPDSACVEKWKQFQLASMRLAVLLLFLDWKPLQHTLSSMCAFLHIFWVSFYALKQTASANAMEFLSFHMRPFWSMQQKRKLQVLNQERDISWDLHKNFNFINKYDCLLGLVACCKRISAKLKVFLPWKAVIAAVKKYNL